jgi:response regulator RpfG family c-di-GMP phosphodiesterase
MSKQYFHEGPDSREKTTIAIVGGSEKGVSILKFLWGDPRARIVALADKDPEAPGLKLARELGIMATTNISKIFEFPDLEMVIALTNPSVLYLMRPDEKIEIMENSSLDFLMRLVRDRERSFEKMAELYQSSVEAFSAAIDARDAYTHRHSLSVQEIGLAISARLGLPQEQTELLSRSCLLHDLGKIGIPDSILLKPAALTDEERAVITRHPVIASKILEKIEVFQPLVPIILHQYERWDGKGTPDGLKGEEIPVGSRILYLSDAFDALVSKRSYREAFTLEEALAILKKASGAQFDPGLVEVLLRIIEEDRGFRERFFSGQRA